MPPSATEVHSHPLHDVKVWLDECTPTADPLVTHRSLTAIVEHVIPLKPRIEMLEARVEMYMQRTEAQQVQIQVLEKTVEELRDDRQAMQTRIHTLETRVQDLTQQHNTTRQVMDRQISNAVREAKGDADRVLRLMKRYNVALKVDRGKHVPNDEAEVANWLGVARKDVMEMEIILPKPDARVTVVIVRMASRKARQAALARKQDVKQRHHANLTTDTTPFQRMVLTELTTAMHMLTEAGLAPTRPVPHLILLSQGRLDPVRITSLQEAKDFIARHGRQGPPRSPTYRNGTHGTQGTVDSDASMVDPPRGSATSAGRGGGGGRGGGRGSQGGRGGRGSRPPQATGTPAAPPAPPAPPAVPPAAAPGPSGSRSFSEVLTGTLSQHRERRGTANYAAGALAESSLRAAKRGTANAPTLSARDTRLHPEGTPTRTPSKALKQTFEGPDLDLPGPEPTEGAFDFVGATQEAAQDEQGAVRDADMDADPAAARKLTLSSTWTRTAMTTGTSQVRKTQTLYMSVV